ncbi:MAG: penicillin-binding protein 2, partial [Moorella sp. (in: Bacteria)]|nr:penicillin-binding protein 2 [Moorella sp. (in: firmicutes)]
IVNTLANLLVGEKAYEGMDVGQIKARIQEKMQAKKLRLYEPVHVAVGVSLEAVARIEEHRLDLPGVVIDVQPVRDYPYGDLLAPVLGYVGEIEKEQLEKHKDKGYQMGDNFGKTGLERQYEEFLRGKRGARLVEVDALGRPVRDLGVEAPTPGNNLILTVDHRLQR